MLTSTPTRLTDEELYVDSYIEYYKATLEVALLQVDTSPLEAPNVEGEVLNFSPSTLHKGRHLWLDKYFRVALRDLSGLTFGSTIILLDRTHYEGTKYLSSLTLKSASPRAVQITFTLSNPRALFDKARSLRGADESTYEDVMEIKTTKSRKPRKTPKQPTIDSAAMAYLALSSIS